MTTVDLDRAFRALADPQRRGILTRLAERPLSVTELAAGTRLTRAAVLQHVQRLEQGGLIATHKTGRVRMCAVQVDGLSTVEGWLADRRLLWRRRLDALGDVLDGSGGSTDGPTGSGGSTR